MDFGVKELVTYCQITEKGVMISDQCDDWKYDGVSWEERA